MRRKQTDSQSHQVNRICLFVCLFVCVFVFFFVFFFFCFVFFVCFCQSGWLACWFGWIASSFFLNHVSYYISNPLTIYYSTFASHSRHPSTTGSTQDAGQDSLRIICIASFSKGFICSAGLGTVHLFEKTEEKDFYKKSREIRIPTDAQSPDPQLAEKQEVRNLTISPSEETLVCGTSTSQLYNITLSTADLGKV